LSGLSAQFREEAPAGVPGEALGYAQALTERLEESLGGRLRAAYLHGSAVLGGWTPGGSDVDMLFVAGNRLAAPEAAAAAAVLAAPRPACPGTGLECSVVTVGQAASPAAPWPFLLHVAHAPGGGRPRVVSGSGHPGDPDLLMHYAVCRAAGLPVSGPPPQDLIGSVPRPVILGYLAGELGWGAAHGTEAYAVLNACRALVFLADGRIVSKVAGGSIAMDRGLAPPALLHRALDQQRGNAPRQAVSPEARDFAQTAATALRSAARREGRAG
jgi:hypothetical protein